MWCCCALSWWLYRSLPTPVSPNHRWCSRRAEAAARNATHTSTASFSQQVTAGDLIVVGASTEFSVEDPTFAVSDTLGSTYTETAANQCVDYFGVDSCEAIFTATAPSTGPDTVTVTVNSPFNPFSIDIFIYELSGVTTAGATTGTGQGNSVVFSPRMATSVMPGVPMPDSGASTPVSTSATSFTNQAFLLGVVNVVEYDPTFTPGAGFTASTPSSGSGQGFAEFSLSGVSSPTTFPGTVNSFDLEWTEVGLALASSPVPTPSGVLYGCTSGNVAVGAPRPTSLYTINPAAGAALSGVPLSSSLYTIDPATGAATLVGPMGVTQCSGLDFGPGGILYAGAAAPDDEGDALYTVNTATGAATFIGTSNNCGPPITDLATDPLNGVLYGTQFDCIVTFNLNTGAATLVGSTSGTTDGNGLAFSPVGQLYYADGCRPVLRQPGERGEHANRCHDGPTRGLPASSHRCYEIQLQRRPLCGPCLREWRGDRTGWSR